MKKKFKNGRKLGQPWLVFVFFIKTPYIAGVSADMEIY